MKVIVNASVDFNHSLAEQKGIALLDETPGDLVVNVDPPMIGTVLRNIISNALKFSNKGARVRISAYRNENMVTVMVQDEGIGMDQETLSKLFSLDNKITRPGTEGEASTGLGLILCKEFVNKHGGEIRAESVPGQGTTFHFSLPSADIKCDS